MQVSFLRHGIVADLALVAAVSLSALAPAAAAPTLYGVTGAGNAPSSLYTIDPTTGATTLVGATGFSHVTGLDFDPTTGVLYGVVSDFFGSGQTLLLTIDPLTGAGTAIGNTGNQIPDITIGPDGIIRGWAEFGTAFDDPIVIDKATGAITATSSPLNTSNTGVASASPTSIYVKEGANLSEVDVNTGAPTYLFNTGFAMNNMLENAPDGTLLSGLRDGIGTQFYSINVATQSAVALGHSSIAFSGLAFQPQAVPEPTSIALTGMAFVALVLRRQRKA